MRVWTGADSLLLFTEKPVFGITKRSQPLSIAVFTERNRLMSLPIHTGTRATVGEERPDKQGLHFRVSNLALDVL